MLAALALYALVAASSGPQSAQASQAPEAPAAAPAPAAKSTGSKIWIGHEREIEEYIKTAPIDHVAHVPVGVTRPLHAFFPAGGPRLASSSSRWRRAGARATSSPTSPRLPRMCSISSWGSAWYRRRWNGEYQRELGSAQLWVESCKLLKQVDPNTSKDITAWNRQVYRQRIWDNLTGNIDRNAGNLLVDPEFNLILIDHSRAFTSTMQMPFPMTRIDRDLFERLKTLPEQDIKTRLSGLLFDGPGALLKRRTYIVKHFEQLIAKQGEGAVLIP